MIKGEINMSDKTDEAKKHKGRVIRTDWETKRCTKNYEKGNERVKGTRTNTGKMWTWEIRWWKETKQETNYS